MQLTQGSAEKILSDMGMSDMPLMEIHPTPSNIPADWFNQYKKLIHEFITTLTDSVETLAFMNLSQDEFMSLIMGQSIPQNISFRFRIPLAFGGKLELDNLFMCWTFPHSNNLDRFIISQTGAQMIWLPNPAKKIYLPAHTAGGGDGGNATEDRLAQMSAQLASGRE